MQVQWKKIPSPIKSIDPYWQISDYIEDAKIHYKPIYQVDFESNGTAWIASSDGLYRYDGYTWKRFTEKDGLPSRLIRCVLVTRDNTLWVGTERGAGMFDGVTYKTDLSEIKLAGPSVRRMVEDKDNKIWFCCDPWPDTSVSGGLTVKQDGVWTTFREKDGLPSDHVMGYFRDSKNRQFVLTNKGLAQFRNQIWIDPLKEANLPEYDSTMWDIVETEDGDIIVSAAQAFFQLHDETWHRIPMDINGDRTPYHLCTTYDDHILSAKNAAFEAFAFLEWDENGFHPVMEDLITHPGGIEQLIEAPDWSVWCIGFNKILRWNRLGSEWKEYDLTATPLFEDRWKRIWFQGDKPVVTQDGEWSELTGLNGRFEIDSDKTVWGWNASTIVQFPGNNIVSYSKEGTGLEVISDLIADASGSIWLHGLDSDEQTRIKRLDGTQWHDMTPNDLLHAAIHRSVRDPKEGIWYQASQPDERDMALHHITPTETLILDLDPAIHPDSIRSFQIDYQGDPWIYGQNGLFFYDLPIAPNNKWLHYPGLSNHEAFTVLSVDKTIWFGLTRKSDGISEIARLTDNRGGWSFQEIDTQQYGTITPDNSVYFGGNGRLYYLPPGWKQAPYILSLPVSRPVQGVVSESNGALWIRAENTLFRYQSDGIPPETSVSKAFGEALEGENLQFIIEGMERFVPANHHGTFRFSWKVNTGSWNDFQTYSSNSLFLAGLGPGRHVLQIRAQDKSLEIDPTPAIIEFYVHPISIQNTWLFKLFVILAFAVISLLAVYALGARRKLARYAQNLESMVDRRTQELKIANWKLESDIVEREQIEASLKESEARYRSFVQNFHGIAFRTTMDFKPIFIHGGVEQITGYTEYEFLTEHSHWDEIIHPDDRYWASKNNDTLTHTPNFECEREYRIIRKDRKVRGIHEYVRNITDESNAPIYIEGTMHDVTERNLLEEQLRQSQKIEAIGQLAGGVAHDFNNLLTGILGNLSLAIEKAPDSIKSFLNQALQAANRSAHLVQQLLAFSRKSRMELTPLNINHIVEEAFRLLRETIDRRIEITVRLNENISTISGNAAQINSIVMNLCVNARDAITDAMKNNPTIELFGDRYEITITTDVVEIDREYCANHSFARPGRFVALSVRDNGTGIPPEIQDHIFEPFFTTKEVGKGTGLGLAGVYGIVKQHQGWIDLISQRNQGTTFFVFFPVVEDKIETKVAISKNERLHGTETILIIDDEEMILDVLKETFTSHGYTVLQASDGVNGLNLLHDNSGKIDLLILDLSMPRMSGREFLQKIDRTRVSAKVIVSSGNLDATSEDSLIQLGATAIVPKPYQPSDLLGRVRNILDNVSV